MTHDAVLAMAVGGLYAASWSGHQRQAEYVPLTAPNVTPPPATPPLDVVCRNSSVELGDALAVVVMNWFVVAVFVRLLVVATLKFWMSVAA